MGLRGCETTLTNFTRGKLDGCHGNELPKAAKEDAAIGKKKEKSKIAIERKGIGFLATGHIRQQNK